MHNRELQYIIDITTAMRDGKMIWNGSKIVEDGEWFYMEGPRLNWQQYDYRIAPEPRKARECWAIMPEGKPEYVRIIGTPIRSLSDSCCVEGSDEIVHMREVLPE